MTKVALGLVVAALLAMLSACNNGGNNNNGTTCNAYGQCYSTSAVGACGTGAFPGYSSAYGPYTWVNNTCYDTVHNTAVPSQYCSASGASPVGNTPFSPYCSSNLGYGSPFVAPGGLPYNSFSTSTLIGGSTLIGSGLGGTGLLGGGICAGAYRWIDPVTGVIQCVPMNQFSAISLYGSPTLTGAGTYFYAGVWL
jgi:hypothetical protein